MTQYESRKREFGGGQHGPIVHCQTLVISTPEMVILRPLILKWRILILSQ